MLARSRSDFIAKRAALTAPTLFLPRLLLCSGLPRASLLTMIDRLGSLGDKSDDKGKTFGQLLVPSATSEWDIGRCGHRREVARKLLGRLSAYSSIHEVTSIVKQNKISWTFVSWLSTYCQENQTMMLNNKSKKSKGSTIETSAISMEFALSLSKRIFQPEDDKSPSEEALTSESNPELVVFHNADTWKPPAEPAIREDSMSTIKFVSEAVSKKDTIALERSLQLLYTEALLPTPRKRRRLNENNQRLNTTASYWVEIAAALLREYSACDRKPDSLTSCVLKWVPRFSQATGNPDLWILLFGVNNNIPPSRLSTLITRCMSCWSQKHAASCRDWILSQTDDVSTLNLPVSIRFLAGTSTQPAVHNETFSGAAAIRADEKWGMTEDFVSKASLLAFAHLEAVGTMGGNQYLSLCRRSDPPESLTLLLLLGRYGRKQMQFICQAIAKRVETCSTDSRKVYLGILLRLYASFPTTMNLGVAVLRSLLKEAIEEYSTEWLLWNSPVDDQFQDLIDSIIENDGSPKLVQILSESSRKHPLLLLRKLDVMEQILERDAIALAESTELRSRGVVFGNALNSPLTAKIGQKSHLQVNIRHWGYNFTDGIWLGFLEVISTGKRFHTHTHTLSLSLSPYVLLIADTSTCSLLPC